MAMMLGVFQIGIGMQNYNAMRSVASDVMRYAVVNYQTNNDLTDQQLRDYARSFTRYPAVAKLLEDAPKKKAGAVSGPRLH